MEQPQADKEFNQFYARVFALAVALLLAYACYRIIAPFMAPIVWAIFLAFLLHPSHMRLTRRLRNRPELSAWILTLIALLVIIGPLAAFGTAFVSQASDLVHGVQGAVVDEARTNLMGIVDHPVLKTILQWAERNIGISTAQIRGWLAEGTRSALQMLAATSGQLFLGALGTVVGLCLTIFLMFFFIRDGAAMVMQVRDLIPMTPDKRRALFAHLASVTRAVVFGSGITALLQGALVGIAFVIVGLPSPMVFGAVAALLSLLPVGGTAFVWVPAAFVLGAQDRWIAAVFMIIWGALLVSMVDNFIRPLLISGRAQVSTLTVFIGVLGGVSAFGAVGLFLGPVVLALAVALIQFILDTKREHELKRST